MNVDRGSIPAGDAALGALVAYGEAEHICHVGVPCRGYHRFAGERRPACGDRGGIVVVYAGGAVVVDAPYLAYAAYAGRHVAAGNDKAHGVVLTELIQKLVPFVGLIVAAQFHNQLVVHLPVLGKQQTVIRIISRHGIKFLLSVVPAGSNCESL